MSNKKPYTLIPMFEELQGERIIVRPYRESDAAAMYEALDESRAHLERWESWPRGVQTQQDVQDLLIRWMAEWLLRKDMYVGYWLRATGQYLGSTEIHALNWEVGSFEIGYWIRVSETGKGYVTEAARLLTDYAFSQLNAKRVEIDCDESNERSAAVPKRLGYVQEARLRNNRRNASGQLLNTLIFALTPEDWSAR